MSFPCLFFNNNREIRAIWRILIFIVLLCITVLPLLLVQNKLIQFFGAVVELIVGLYINSKYLDKRKFTDYGLLVNKETFIQLLVGLLIGALSVIILLMIGKTTKILSVSTVTANSDFSSILFFGATMFLVAILEETFFRGYLFTNFKDAFKSEKLTCNQTSSIALFLSSLCFGLAHFGNNGASFISIAALTLNGIVWCIPFIMTKNLGLSIGMHTAWNFMQTQLGFTMSGNKALKAFLKIENSGPDFLTGGDYGPEAGILGLVGFGIMLLFSLFYFRFANMKFSHLL